MQVMIVEEDPTLRTQITGALAPEGVDILSFGRLGPAKEAARRATVDILVLGETVEGRLASDVALLAEWRNPRLGSILLSNRDAEAAEELFDLIPSLQAVLARGTGARTLARVAIATARSQEAMVILQEDSWTPQDSDGPAAEEDGAMSGPVSPDEEEDPLAATASPLPEGPAPAADVTAPGPVPVAASEDPALPEPETFASLRERLLQAQEKLAALETRAPAAELPTPRHEVAEGGPGVLYGLPSFLRVAGDPEEGESRDDAPPRAPHPAFLPAAEVPRRRLNLA